MGRILGIDYGGKRTGLAVTDPLQIIVNPLTTIETSKLVDFLKNYFESEEVEKIVIGKATHADGSPVSIEKDIQKFLKELVKLFPETVIDRQDEYYTSQEAKQIMLDAGLPKKKRRNKEQLDKISAVLILQRYLGHI